METLITFRQGIDSLTDTEYEQCITLIGKKLVTYFIFSGLQQQIYNNKMDNVNEINEIIKQVKELRKNNENSPNEEMDLEFDNIDNHEENITLDNIPSVLLSEISSYLIFDEKIKFEQTNRLIFIGVRFNKLPLYSLSGKNFLNLVRYCNKHDNKYISSIAIFKSLTINGPTIVECDEHGEEHLSYEFNYFKLFDYITTLQITVNYGWDLEPIWLHLFERTNLPNLKSLKIICDGELHMWNTDPFNIQQLTNQATLEYIEITAAPVYPEDDAIDNDFCKFVSLLKGFAINNFYDENLHENVDEDVDNMMVNIYKSFGNKFESFHKGNNLQILNAINGKLNKLQELCLSLKDDIKILLNQNMNKLKRIYFGNIGVTIQDIEKESMELFFSKIIKNVNYIGLSINNVKGMKINNLLMQMDILIKSLGNIRKNKLKIRMDNMNILKSDNVKKIVQKIEILINILNTNCLNWMFIGCEWQMHKNNKLLLDSLKIMGKKYDVKFESNVSNINFVIKNKECIINGYYEKWIMECQCCKQNNLFD